MRLQRFDAFDLVLRADFLAGILVCLHQTHIFFFATHRRSGKSFSLDVRIPRAHQGDLSGRVCRKRAENDG